MYTESDKEKMKTFIQRLFTNPCFVKEPALKVEEQILLFLVQNSQALKNTFSSTQYFPNLSWQNVQDLFYQTLVNITDSKIIPLIKVVLSKIDFNFINVSLNRQIPNEEFKNQLYEFLLELIKRYEIRKTLEPILKIIAYGLLDKYLNEIFMKKSYIAFELEKVEKLKLKPEMITNYTKIVVIFQLLGFIRTDIAESSIEQKVSAGGIKFRNAVMQKAFYDNILKQFSKRLTLFPEELPQKGLQSHFNFIDDPTIPATSRLAKIFYNMAKSFKKKMKIDRGAETFEKSWLQIQRKNYKFFGFDTKMLDELYRIAADNYW